MIGPNDFPINAVPNCWIKKSAVMMINTIGITGIVGLTNANPSMADITVIDGVIIPSARSVLPPIMANMYNHDSFFRSSANSENIPPSPLLSARSVIITYFMVVCSVSVQIMQESEPIISNSSIVELAPNIAFITYNGDVPMSPNTIPSDTISPAKLSFLS